MCRTCWDEAGRPTDRTPKTEHLLQLIGDLYDIHSVGGPLHTVLDDWNLDGTITPYYDGYQPEELDAPWWGGSPVDDLDPAAPAVVEGRGRSMRSLCDEIATLLNGMTERERIATMAYYDGFAKPPSP